MKLTELLRILPEYQSTAAEIDVVSLAHDARQVQAGTVFFAIPGNAVDGHQFLRSAVDAGAIALIVEKMDLVPPDFRGFVQVVPSTRQALDHLAAHFFAYPSRDLLVFGVTGTNGKTSITYLLEEVLGKVQFPCGVLGTINHHLGDRVWDSQMTTPDPLSLQQRLREMKDAGARSIAMEVSSHALDQFRADGVDFNTVIFTNLTRDHLDYHSTMQKYFESKRRLFTDLLWKSKKSHLFAIINTDDLWGARMRISARAGLWTYGENAQADFRFKITHMNFSQTDFELVTPFGVYQSQVPLCGRYNVANAVAVVAAAATMGFAPRLTLDILSRFAGVPGRLQTVPNQRSLNVFVDYAHTPDALESVLRALNQVRRDAQSPAKIWTVFGCGGDRDKGKRPLMAEKALAGSDFVMVTSDNPRQEEPEAIVADIVRGVSAGDKSSRLLIETDRKLAIERVLGLAQPHDVVLIAGKGHENYQILKQEKIHFSDYEVAREFLK